MFLNFLGQRSEHPTTITLKKFLAIQQISTLRFSPKTPMHSLTGAIQMTIKKFHSGRAPHVDQNQLFGDRKERASPLGLICLHMALRLLTTLSKSCLNTGATSIKTVQEVSIVTNLEFPTRKCHSYPPTLKWTFWIAITTVFCKEMN